MSLAVPEILDSLWASDEYPAEATVRSHIRRLRTRLIDAGADKDCIANVHGRGYFLKFQEKSDLPTANTKVINERQFSPQLASANVAQQFQSFLEETWQQFRPKGEQILKTIYQTLQNIQAETITLDEAEEAQHLTHKLAGTIGLFNQEAAMKSAHILEAYFEMFIHDHCQEQGRSQFETSPAYLTHSEQNHHFVILETALAELSAPPSRQRHGLVVLNLDPKLTNMIQAAGQSLACPVEIIQTLEAFPDLYDSSLSTGLLIPLDDDLSALWAIESRLQYLKQVHPNLTIIAISALITFETRLQAIRWGWTILWNSIIPHKSY
ncbi:MAG: winged helix-turn-helix domain-containing protein [Acaryochloridaceae cyanobacterium RL_2_7]|nr:winged helix-turn-helix domain-containing protein [Acaryochloridaceae cyanobacterium RL_2_7]